MAEWGRVKDILALKQTSGTPHPGDSTALIPHTFINIIRRLRDARLKLVEQQKRANADGTDDKLISIGPSFVREVAAAVQELHTHFEKLLSNEEKLKEAMRGYEKGTVVWVEPSAQPDFISFMSSLCDQYGGLSSPRPEVSQLIEWALNVDIGAVLDDTGVEQAIEAYRSVQGAFETFQTAHENMLHEQEELLEQR